LEVIITVDELMQNYRYSLEKSFGMDPKRPLSAVDILLPTEGTTRIETTKSTMERQRPSYDSWEQALTAPCKCHDDYESLQDLFGLMGKTNRSRIS
jgi:hypothetical protein